MKTYKYIVTTIIVSLFAISAWSSAQALQQFTKQISEEFSIKPNGMVDISNKYGNIDIETSDRSSVSFEIVIIVEARNRQRADEIIDKIHIDFSNIPSKVQAKTTFNFGNRMSTKKNESYKVIYRVKMPKDVNLKLYNKYGDLSSTSIMGDMDIDLKYGHAHLQDISGDLKTVLGYVQSFDVGNIGGDLTLSTKYSDINIESVHDVDISSKYCDLYVGSAGEMRIESKYDDYDIQKASSIKIIGKYDNYKIGQCSLFSTDTKYTQIRIKSLYNGGNFETQYGSVKINRLHKGFESLLIESGYTGYTIGIDAGVRFDIDTKYTDIDLSNDLTLGYKVKDGNEYKLRGYYKSDDQGIIEAKMRYGHLKVMHRP